jgi:hypothetical protein
MTPVAFVAGLAAAGIELDLERMRDALWLAARAPPIVLGYRDPADPEVPVKPGPVYESVTPTDKPRPGVERPQPEPEQGKGTWAEMYGLAPSHASARPGRPVSLPASHALPSRLRMARAMRPFRQYWPERVAGALDEERTADAAAELQGVIWPRFQPRRDRWYDAELVLEDDPAIAVWTDVVAEFAQVMRDSGAFGDVRTWRLCDAAAGTPILKGQHGRQVAAGSLGDGSVRRLVLFVTHGAALSWADGAYARVLALWRRRASLAIVQAMPRHQWRRTVLGEPQGVCRAAECGAPTAELPPIRDWWTHSEDNRGAELAVPLVALSAESLAGFAGVQMGRKRVVDAVFLDPSPPFRPDPSRAAATRGRVEAMVALLQAESAQAFQLAVYLSAAAFTLPVARLVQEAKFGRNADPACLGELLLGGLVESRPPDSGDSALMEFDFQSEARGILQRSMRPGERLRLRDALIGHVSDHLAAIQGRISRMQAFTPDEAGTLYLPDWAQPFARMADALAGPASPAEGLMPPTRVGFLGETQPEIATLLGQVLIETGCILISSGKGGAPSEIASLFEAGRPARAIQADDLLAQADVIALLGDPPPSPALMKPVAGRGILILPLWASGIFALQCRYGSPEVTGQALTRHPAEIGFLHDMFSGLLRGLGHPARRGDMRAASHYILHLLAGSSDFGQERRIMHPRAAIYLAGLRATAGSAEAVLARDRGALERLAVRTPDWLVANLLALDGVSAQWTVGIAAQAQIVSTLLRGDGAGRLWAMAEMLRESQAPHIASPLTNLLSDARFSRRGAKRMSLRAITAALQRNGDVPDATLPLEELADRFLRADNTPDFVAILRPLQLAAARRRSEMRWPNIAWLLGSHNQVDRVQAYILLHTEPDARLWKEAAGLCRREWGWAGKTAETRVLWLLLLAIKAALKNTSAESTILWEVRLTARSIQEYLVQTGTLDKGGECRTELATLIDLLESALAKDTP